MRSLRLTARLLVLSLVAYGVSFAAPKDNSTASQWFLADFNGDLQTDVATTKSAVRDSHGYSQQISVDLGQSGETSFEFRSRTARVELNAWDIDGDNDRDIIIREPLSRRPIGVWLNDGRGSFTEANLDKFQNSLRPEAPVLRAKPAPRALFAVSEQRGDALLPATQLAGDQISAQFLTAISSEVPRDVRRSDLRPRAPPSHS